MRFTPGDGSRKADVGRNTPEPTSPADGSQYVLVILGTFTSLPKSDALKQGSIKDKTERLF
jgi:hypothetical protein